MNAVGLVAISISAELEIVGLLRLMALQNNGEL